MDTLYGGGGDDTMIGGGGADGYVYLPGDGIDVIIDGSTGADVDELLLAGGIAPDEVGVLRVGHGDLLLTVPSGMLLVKDFFSSAGAGIDRVVFDHAPGWTREDLMLRAVDAPPAYAHLVAGGETVIWPEFLADVPDDLTSPPLPDWHLETHATGLF